MNDLTDQQLLRDYANCQSDSAFAELVRRNIDLVYSAALRMVCDPDAAKDVTQGVFLALAQTARHLTDRPALSGWLHRTAQNLAAKAVRSDVRRRAREQEAATMNELLSAEPDATWEQIALHLDEALSELSEPDRDALLLRYFERKSAHEMAQTLGITDDAAQKRVNRAVERLREFFVKRGVTISASGLVVAISTNAVQAAPAGLAATISTTAALAAAITSSTAPATIAKTIAMTTLQKTLIGVTLTAAVGTGFYQAQQASNARSQLRARQQNQPPLNEQIQKLTRDRDDGTQQLVLLRDENERLNRDTAELLRLRGEVTRLRLAAQGSAKQPALVGSSQTGQRTSAEVGVEQQMRDAEIDQRLNQLREKLGLTKDQEGPLRKILANKMAKADQLLEKFRKSPPDSPIVSETFQAAEDSENAINSLLTPDQQAAYLKLKQEQWAAIARLSANGELLRMQNALALTQEQQDSIFPVLYAQVLKENMRMEGASSLVADAQEPTPQTLNESLQQSTEHRMRALEKILTPPQLQKYREFLAQQRGLALSGHSP